MAKAASFAAFGSIGQVAFEVLSLVLVYSVPAWLIVFLSLSRSGLGLVYFGGWLWWLLLVGGLLRHTAEDMTADIPMNARTLGS